MTPFGIRRAIRRGAAFGLRQLAELVRPDEAVFHAEGEVETAISPGRESSASALEPSSLPEHVAASMAAAAERASEEEPELDPQAAMALMAGLSGDMGPAISARVAEQRDEAGASDDPVHAQIIEALHTIFDPEIPVDIYELGLIYGVDVRGDGSVGVTMTLTSPNCPAAQDLPAEVQTKVKAVDGVERADVDVVFDPPWTPDLMSDEAKLELNMM